MRLGFGDENSPFLGHRPFNLNAIIHEVNDGISLSPRPQKPYQNCSNHGETRYDIQNGIEGRLYIARKKGRNDKDDTADQHSYSAVTGTEFRRKIKQFHTGIPPFRYRAAIAPRVKDPGRFANYSPQNLNGLNAARNWLRSFSRISPFSLTWHLPVFQWRAWASRSALRNSMLGHVLPRKNSKLLDATEETLHRQVVKTAHFLRHQSGQAVLLVNRDSFGPATMTSAIRAKRKSV